jgi:hypothetical protein
MCWHFWVSWNPKNLHILYLGTKKNLPLVVFVGVLQLAIMTDAGLCASLVGSGTAWSVRLEQSLSGGDTHLMHPRLHIFAKEKEGMALKATAKGKDAAGAEAIPPFPHSFLRVLLG